MEAVFCLVSWETGKRSPRTINRTMPPMDSSGSVGRKRDTKVVLVS